MEVDYIYWINELRQLPLIEIEQELALEIFKDFELNNWEEISSSIDVARLVSLAGFSIYQSRSLISKDIYGKLWVNKKKNIKQIRVNDALGYETKRKITAALFMDYVLQKYFLPKSKKYGREIHMREIFRSEYYKRLSKDYHEYFPRKKSAMSISLKKEEDKSRKRVS